MTREETKKIKEVMQHFEDGGEIEYAPKGARTWKVCVSPKWNWSEFNYRIKLPSLKVTKEEKNHMEGRVWMKNKFSGSMSFENPLLMRNTGDYYFLNSNTQEWEDWSEDTDKLKHHYNGGQP